MSDTRRIVALLVIYGFVVYLVLTFADNFYQVDDSFEPSAPVSPLTVNWYFTGTLPVSVTRVGLGFAKDGRWVAQLGERVEPAARSKEQALLYRTMVIPNYDRPVLTFWYRMFANDTIDFSDFRVDLLTSDGNPGEEITGVQIKRDGFRTCNWSKDGYAEAPKAACDLDWRMASHDLSGRQGETVTLVFENNNLCEGWSMGIWTWVDYVEIVDAALLPTPPGPPRAYLPVVIHEPCNPLSTCDPIPTEIDVEALDMPPAAVPTRPPTPTPEPR